MSYHTDPKAKKASKIDPITIQIWLELSKKLSKKAVLIKTKQYLNFRLKL